MTPKMLAIVGLIKMGESPNRCEICGRQHEDKERLIRHLFYGHSEKAVMDKWSAMMLRWLGGLKRKQRGTRA